VNRDLLLLILSAAVKSRITDSRVFPRLAEALIGKGIESPATVELAVLGTEPFDPRDARELAGQMLSELGVSVPTDNVAADVIGGLTALALEWGWITPRTLTHLAAQLMVMPSTRAWSPISDCSRIISFRLSTRSATTPP
jgi:hypothetical protein